MDRREVFDKVKTHLLAQGKPAYSFDDDGLASGCMYHGNTGLKCAIGCLIPSYHYTTEIEGKGVDSLAVCAILKDIGVPTDAASVEMYQELQEIHDVVDPDNWAERIDEIEEQFFGESR